MDNLTLFFNIAGLVVGSGVLVYLFNAGKRMGEIETQIKQLQDEPDGVSTAEVDKRIATVKEAIVNEIHVAANNINARVDDVQQLMQTAQHDIGSGTEAIKSIRRDWDALNNELRHLLRSEATGTADIGSLKERFNTLDHKVTELLQRVASVAAQVDGLRDRRS